MVDPHLDAVRICPPRRVRGRRPHCRTHTSSPARRRAPGAASRSRGRACPRRRASPLSSSTSAAGSRTSASAPCTSRSIRSTRRARLLTSAPPRQPPPQCDPLEVLRKNPTRVRTPRKSTSIRHRPRRPGLSTARTPEGRGVPLERGLTPQSDIVHAPNLVPGAPGLQRARRSDYACPHRERGCECRGTGLQVRGVPAAPARGLVAALDGTVALVRAPLRRRSKPRRIVGDADGLADADAHVKLVRLSRNFGQHAAITAGLEHARGEWIVVMDCDLQDPPEQIPTLYRARARGSTSFLHAASGAATPSPGASPRRRTSDS